MEQDGEQRHLSGEDPYPTYIDLPNISNICNLKTTILLSNLNLVVILFLKLVLIIWCLKLYLSLYTLFILMSFFFYFFFFIGKFSFISWDPIRLTLFENLKICLVCLKLHLKIHIKLQIKHSNFIFLKFRYRLP